MAVRWRSSYSSCFMLPIAHQTRPCPSGELWKAYRVLASFTREWAHEALRLRGAHAAMVYFNAQLFDETACAVALVVMKSTYVGS